MNADERNADHIWLRQSVTFTVHGQTRTIEITIPVPRGAAPQEIEALLDEADAGMTRLARHLDARVAEALHPSAGGEARPAPREAPVPIAAPSAAEAIVEPAPTTQRATHPAAAPMPAPAPSAPPSAGQPARGAPAGPPPTPPREASRETRPAAPAPPLPVASQKPTPGLREPVPSAGPAAGGPDLSRKDFLAGAAELGLGPRQAMDQLGVRSLEGLNLREALASLQRQVLRDGGTPSDSQRDARNTAPAPEETPPPSPNPTPAPRYFEEEDEAAYTFEVEDEQTPALESGRRDSTIDAAAMGELGEMGIAADDLDFALDEVPDFEPVPSRPAPEPAPPPTPQRRTSPRPPQAPPQAAPEGNGAALSGAEHARALPRIGQLRAAQGGGAATPHQLTAYKNLVIGQLGEQEAAALVRGLWRMAPAQLGADQLDMLIRWSKEDAFAEDAALVLAALRAERARASATSGVPAGEAAAPRTGARGRTGASGSGGPAGGR